MQTAGIRSLLEPEYEFEFVEGRWPHLEGNWSLHTVDFSKSNVSIPDHCFLCWVGSQGAEIPLYWASLPLEVPTLSASHELGWQLLLCMLTWFQAVWFLQYVGY